MASDCKVKNLQSLKREIRALLISSKHGCTPKRLEDDYLKVMGESIPYHFLGHTNFMSFIYSIPDVVSVCRSRNNIVLYGVADDATKKIQSLVSRQKSKTRHLSFTSHPRMNQVTKTTNPAPREPAVPLMFKTYLKELMLSHPNGIALNLFNEAFAKRYHHYIAFRNWGFETLESMVRAVPDVLWVHDDTTRNIKMVKRVLPQNKVDLVTKDSQGRGIDWYSLGKERRHSISEGTEKQGEKNGATVKSVGNGRHEQVKAPLQPKKRDAGVSSSLHSLELSPQMKKKVLDDIRRPLPAPEVKKSVPKDVSSKIKALLQANQSGIWVSRFLMEFRVRLSMCVCMWPHMHVVCACGLMCVCACGLTCMWCVHVASCVCVHVASHVVCPYVVCACDLTCGVCMWPHMCVCMWPHMCVCMWPHMCVCMWPHMCVCMWPHVCVHVASHVCVHVASHVCVHVASHVCVHVASHVCVHVASRVCACGLTCVCMWPHMCVCMWPHVCVHVASRVCMWPHMCVCMWPHVCVCMWPHMCVCMWPHVCVCMWPHVWYVHVASHVCVHVASRVCVHVASRVCVHVCVHVASHVVASRVE